MRPRASCCFLIWFLPAALAGLWNQPGCLLFPSIYFLRNLCLCTRQVRLKGTKWQNEGGYQRGGYQKDLQGAAYATTTTTTTRVVWDSAERQKSTFSHSHCGALVHSQSVGLLCYFRTAPSALSVVVSVSKIRRQKERTDLFEFGPVALQSRGGRVVMRFLLPVLHLQLLKTDVELVCDEKLGR